MRKQQDASWVLWCILGIMVHPGYHDASWVSWCISRKNEIILLVYKMMLKYFAYHSSAHPIHVVSKIAFSKMSLTIFLTRFYLCKNLTA